MRSTNGRHSNPGRERGPVRYAVLGAGHIAQKAALPAFAHTGRHCRLTALISGDPRKRAELGRMYGIAHLYDYADFDSACREGVFDAVYVALPNSMHAEYVERAAAAGVHVLCEKPLGVTARECRGMIRSARRHGVALMTAYRLHFEPANLRALDRVRRGELGDPRVFHSVFTMQVRRGNIRLEKGLGGGPLRDIGIYCVNAARNIFGTEPLEVTAQSVRGPDGRFREVPEAVGASMVFPGDRLATFVCSFGGAAADFYQVVGTRGHLLVENGYEYAEEIRQRVTIDDKARRFRYKKRDQFAPELIYFADCIRNGHDPEPGGAEGLNDVRVIEAIEESAARGRSVRLGATQADRHPRPRASQEMTRPPVRNRRLVGVKSAHEE